MLDSDTKVEMKERPLTLAQNSTALPAHMALDANKAAKRGSEEQPESLLAIAKKAASIRWAGRTPGER